MNTDPVSNSSLILQEPACLITSISLNIWFGVTALISLFGSFLYMVLLGTIFITPKLRTGTGVLIIHLLLLEFIICFLFHPVWIIETYFRSCMTNQILMYFNCQGFQLVRITTIHAANWSSLLLAVNRLVAILMPRQYPSWTSKMVLGLMISISWVITLCCNITAYFKLEETYGGCGRRSDLEDENMMYSMLTWIGVGAFTPSLFLAVIYAIVFVRLAVFHRNRSRSAERTRNQKQEFLTIKSRGNIAKMLLASAIWYWICFLPVPLFVLFTPDFYHQSTSIRLWARALFLFGYAANPLIYLAMNGDYRAGLSKLISYVSNKREFQGSACTGSGPPTLL